MESIVNALSTFVYAYAESLSDPSCCKGFKVSSLVGTDTSREVNRNLTVALPRWYTTRCCRVARRQRETGRNLRNAFARESRCYGKHGALARNRSVGRRENREKAGFRGRKRGFEVSGPRRRKCAHIRSGRLGAVESEIDELGLGRERK